MLGIFQGFGPTELIIILVIILLLFGAKKLPEMARSLGQSSKEFKKGMEDGAKDDGSSDQAVDNPGDTSSKE